MCLIGMHLRVRPGADTWVRPYRGLEERRRTVAAFFLTPDHWPLATVYYLPPALPCLICFL